MLAILTGYLALSAQAPSDQERIKAVQSVVALAKRVEAVCRPRFLTTPPTPVRVIPDLPIVPGWAEPRKVGGYHVGYGDLGGFVEGDSVEVIFRQRPKLPEGARLWTEAECLANARAVAELVRPEGFLLGESTVVTPGEFYPCVRTEVVLAQDPRLLVKLIDLRMDPRTGLPDEVETGGFQPEVVSARLQEIRPVEELVAEATRVHRSLPPIGPARVTWSRLVYQVARFSRSQYNEMTDEHRGNEARKEAIPFYEWVLRSDQGTDGISIDRVIVVDARTGKGIAATDFALTTVGGSSRLTHLSIRPNAGLWRLGRAAGTFAKVANSTFEGVPAVVTNDKGEVLTLRFDRRSGLVRDDAGTYRPDAALLKALRAEGPVRAFGTKR